MTGSIELTSAIQCHPSRPHQIVILYSFLLNQLLCHGIARGEQHGGSDALGQQRARRQLHLIPSSMSARCADQHGSIIERDVPPQHVCSDYFVPELSSDAGYVGC